MTDLLCYSLMSWNSQVLMRKLKKRWGKPYHYNPQIRLMRRLSQQTGIPLDQIRNQIMKERFYLLKKEYGEDNIKEWMV